MSKFREAFIKYKTDKFHGHKYDRVYNLVIEDEPIDSVLEVGAYRGYSLRAWKDIWPNAVVEGIETDDHLYNLLKDEFKIYHADSSKPIPELADKSYDLIVDDGDHYWEYQYNTFVQLFDKAKKFYVIEDVLGNVGLKKLSAALPKEMMDLAEIYDSVGVRRNFQHGSVIEHEARYRIMVFDKR